MPLTERPQGSLRPGLTGSQRTPCYSDPSSCRPRSIGRSRRATGEGPNGLVRTCKMFGTDGVSDSKPRLYAPPTRELQEQLVWPQHPSGGHVVVRQKSQITSWLNT